MAKKFDNNSHFEVNCSVYNYNTVGDLHCVHIPSSELCSNWIKKMNRWNNFCKPSTGREFFPHFGWKYYLKTSLWENLFQDFFLFLLLREIFSLTFGWKYYLKTSLWKNLFQDFFSFSSTGRVFTLILGCNLGCYSILSILIHTKIWLSLAAVCPSDPYTELFHFLILSQGRI